MEERVLEGYLENVVLFCSILYHASQGGKSCTDLDLEENFKPEHTTHSQMLGKFEYTRGPIFKVVLEC